MDELSERGWLEVSTIKQTAVIDIFYRNKPINVQFFDQRFYGPILLTRTQKFNDHFIRVYFTLPSPYIPLKRVEI